MLHGHRLLCAAALLITAVEISSAGTHQAVPADEKSILQFEDIASIITDHRALQLQNGQPRSGTVFSQVRYGAHWDYFFEVPAGATYLSIQIVNQSGDVDLFVRRGRQPDFLNFDCRSIGDGASAESCVLFNPAPGEWKIRVSNWNTGRQDYTVTATTSNLGNQTLTVARSGTGTGTVASDPSAVNCGPTCASGIPFGTTVQLSPAASPGSVFAGWSGDCNGTGTCSIVMTGAKSVAATFNQIAVPPFLSLSPATSSIILFDGNGAASPILATPSGGSLSGAAATTTLGMCNITGGGVAFPVNSVSQQTFIGATTTPQALALPNCVPQATQVDATLTCPEARASNPVIQRQWTLRCPAMAAPNLTYQPPSGATVNYAGSGSSNSVSATPAGGSGAGPGATTVIGPCSIDGGGAAFPPTNASLSFTGTSTVAQTMALPNCTPQSLPTTATLNCPETRGGAAPVNKTWTLACPASGNIAPTVEYAPAISTTITYSGSGSGNPITVTPGGGGGGGTQATTVVGACTITGGGPAFPITSIAQLTFVGSTLTPQSLALPDCNPQSAIATATLACPETRGGTPQGTRTWTLQCPARSAPTVSFSPAPGTTINAPSGARLMINISCPDEGANCSGSGSGAQSTTRIEKLRTTFLPAAAPAASAPSPTLTCSFVNQAGTNVPTKLDFLPGLADSGNISCTCPPTLVSQRFRVDVEERRPADGNSPVNRNFEVVCGDQTCGAISGPPGGPVPAILQLAQVFQIPRGVEQIARCELEPLNPVSGFSFHPSQTQLIRGAPLTADVSTLAAQVYCRRAGIATLRCSSTPSIAGCPQLNSATQVQCTEPNVQHGSNGERGGPSSSPELGFDPLTESKIQYSASGAPRPITVYPDAGTGAAITTLGPCAITCASAESGCVAAFPVTTVPALSFSGTSLASQTIALPNCSPQLSGSARATLTCPELRDIGPIPSGLTIGPVERRWTLNCPSGALSQPLNATIDGNGAGVVTSIPPGINCSQTNTPCVGQFAEGQEVTLTAFPNQGAAFDGWVGDCIGESGCSLAMSTSRNVSARFNVLTNGQATAGNIDIAATGRNYRTFGFALPSGIASLVVSLGNLTHDADLYIRQGQPPTLSDFTCRPFKSGSQSEVCTIANPAAGQWFVRVYDFDGTPQDFELSATWILGPNIFANGFE